MTSPITAEFAPAKINLFLHVLGRKPNGYHDLDMLVTFCDAVGDRIVLENADRFSLNIIGPFSYGLDSGPENLVVRAARALFDAVDRTLPPVKITLEKNLPIASGIGGGSADAAAVLRALVRHCDLKISQPDLDAIGLGLGADLPMCLFSKPARVQGIGEKIKPQSLPHLHLVLANCGREVSTGHIFSQITLGKRPSPADISTDHFIEFLSHQRNDLQDAAIQLVPEIGDCLKALAQEKGCQLARMSGSGATCFGIFPDDAAAKRAVSSLEKQHPEWWIACSKTGSAS